MYLLDVAYVFNNHTRSCLSDSWLMIRTVGDDGWGSCAPLSATAFAELLSQVTLLAGRLPALGWSCCSSMVLYRMYILAVHDGMGCGVRAILVPTPFFLWFA